MDLGTSKAFLKILQKQGLNFRLGTKVIGAKRDPNGVYSVSVESAKGDASETVQKFFRFNI